MKYKFPTSLADVYVALRSIGARFGFFSRVESTATRDWRMLIVLGVVVFVGMSVYSVYVYTQVANENVYAGIKNLEGVLSDGVKTLNRNDLKRTVF